MSKVLIAKEDIVDFEDVQKQKSISDNTTGNEILTLTTKNALRGFLAFVGVAWDVTLDTFLTWRMKSNGAVIYQLQDSKVQIATPGNPIQELTPWIELPQQCRLSLEMDLSGAGVAGNGTGRFRVYYAKVESGLYVPRY